MEKYKIIITRGEWDEPNEETNDSKRIDINACLE